MKSILAFLSLFAATLSFAKVNETVTQTFPIAPNGALELSNVNGAVDVQVWDKNEINVVAEKSASDEDTLKLITIDFDASPDKVKISTRYEKRWFGSSNGEVRYTLKVPAGLAKIKVNTVNAGINAEGLRGRLSMETVNGSIHVAGARSDIALETVNGRIDAKMDELPSGAEVLLKTVNGSCELFVPSTTSAKLDASAVNGRVRCSLPIVIESSRRSSLKGTIGDGASSIRLRSVNGSLSVAKL